MSEYPNPCNHCGMCCLIEVCPVGLEVMGISKEERRQKCPALQWGGNESKCGLVTNPGRYTSNPAHVAALKNCGPEIIGSGKGCCISAKVVTDGVAVEFADLPDTAKILIAQRTRCALS